MDFFTNTMAEAMDITPAELKEIALVEWLSRELVELRLFGKRLSVSPLVYDAGGKLILGKKLMQILSRDYEAELLKHPDLSARSRSWQNRRTRINQEIETEDRRRDKIMADARKLGYRTRAERVKDKGTVNDAYDSCPGCGVYRGQFHDPECR